MSLTIFILRPCLHDYDFIIMFCKYDIPHQTRLRLLKQARAICITASPQPQCYHSLFGTCRIGILCQTVHNKPPLRGSIIVPNPIDRRIATIKWSWANVGLQLLEFQKRNVITDFCWCYTEKSYQFRSENCRQILENKQHCTYPLRWMKSNHSIGVVRGSKHENCHWVSEQKSERTATLVRDSEL